MYIYSNHSANQIHVFTDAPLHSVTIRDMNGADVACLLLTCTPDKDGFHTLIDASALQPWTLESPVLYTMEANGESIRFGHCSVKTFQNKMVLFNDAPIYLRGYIRGIIAHDHPNMTGQSDYEAAVKNIRQAKNTATTWCVSTAPSPPRILCAQPMNWVC